MIRFASIGLAALALSSACGMAGANTPPTVTSSVGPEALPLTAVEKEWIARHPVIRVGQDTGYPPYSFHDRDGKVVCINISYLGLIAQRTGLRFATVARETWEQAVTAFNDGQADMLMGMVSTPEREKRMVFTNAYDFEPTATILRDDSSLMFTAQQLNGKRVGIPRGFVGITVLLKQTAPQAILVDYDTTEDVLRAVSRGDIYATVGEINTCTYLANSLHLDNLRIGGFFAESLGDRMGVRKDWPELAGILNKAVDNIGLDERVRINSAWLQVDNAPVRPWIKLFKVAAATAAGLTVVFLLVLLHDRRLARELAERRRVELRLKDVHEEKDSLVNTIAHDLRSPLTAILLGSDAIQNVFPGDPRLTAEAAGQIKEQASRMKHLITDLLEVHKLEAAAQAIAFGPLNAVAVVSAAVRLMKPLAAQKNIRLVQEGAAGVELISDAKALQHVIDNLLSNAVKFSPHNSRVTVVIGREAGGCRISVRDQGPGVKPEEREKIFDRYGRGSAKPTSGESSFGLGLWIVRRLVTGLHGKVWCESPAGQGATFIVELPLVPPKG
jgi:signal transduction histidine kinase